jgi:hypothetical protein
MPRSALAFLTALVLLLGACEKRPETGGPLLPDAGRRVFVVCEGAYGNGNSALTVYYPDSGVAISDAYARANGRSLGDVFQSMVAIPATGSLMLCINNSDRVSFVDEHSLRETGTMNLPKPRYAVTAGSEKAYVSSLFGNKVYVVNPGAQSIVRSIDMPHRNPEGMALAAGRLWVATWDSAAAHIYAIDTAADRIADSFLIAGRAPQEIEVDAEGMLWVLSGNDAQGVGSKLTRLNAGGAILKSYDFGPAVAIKPVFNASRDTLYFLEVAYNGGGVNNGVYRMGIHDAVLPAQPFVAAQGLQYFWAVGVHPHSGNVYVGDAKGFSQKGLVRVYRPDGRPLDSFATGVGPGHFFFE